jgi:hypothetical protein
VDESVDESVEALEERISALRADVRRAVRNGESHEAAALRRELKDAEQAWEQALAQESPAAAPLIPQPAVPSTGPLLPLREQVHEALSLLQVPAAPRLIATVHEAFFATTFPTARLTSLRRDEERSFSTAPFARPYYICAALAADFLSPSRGLLAISTWPLERRMIGPLSPRVDFLVSAVNVANAIELIPDPVPAARALLTRFAANVRGSSPSGSGAFGAGGAIVPQAVIRAAQAELEVHQDQDRRTRAEAASRAREQLDEVQQLFGAASFREARRRLATGEELRCPRSGWRDCAAASRRRRTMHGRSPHWRAIPAAPAGRSWTPPR